MQIRCLMKWLNEIVYAKLMWMMNIELIHSKAEAHMEIPFGVIVDMGSWVETERLFIAAYPSFTRSTVATKQGWFFTVRIPVENHRMLYLLIHTAEQADPPYTGMILDMGSWVGIAASPW